MKSTTTKLMAAAAMSVGMASSAFAAQTPIIGSGYNADVIADAGDTTIPVSSVSAGGIDSQFAYYQAGFVTLNPTFGLPTGGTVTSVSDANTTFSLRPAGGSNVVQLTNAAPSATFSLTTPAAYSSLSFAATATNGNHPFNYTFSYTDGTSSSAQTLTGPDNFGGTPVAIFTGGRVDIASGGASTDNTNPRIYQLDTTGIDSSKTLSSISFTATDLGDPGTIRQTVDFFGFSGTAGAVPEPASLGLLGLGGLTLLRRRRA